MNIQTLEKELDNLGQPKYRVKQVVKAIFQDGVFCFSEVTSLPKDLRDRLESQIRILSFEVKDVLVSKDGRAAKALLELEDGDLIETVLISPKPGVWSCCISCQVGCPLGCRFCATGKIGFRRDLTAEEITDQVLFWRQYLANQKGLSPHYGDLVPCLSNIVYMGMGEPFLNWKNVKESLKILTDENLFGFGSRSISVSTAGVVDGIEKFGEEFPQVNLAISLHFADDLKRSEFMPINRKYNLESLESALKDYFQKNKRKVFLEYILLKGINDSESDAKKLAEFIKSVGYCHLLHTNLIRYNSTSEGLVPSSKEKTINFKNYLLQKGLSVTIRKSLGDDIHGACGQLAGEKNAEIANLWFDKNSK